MDFSCKACFQVWVCCWCKNRWCDDTGCPFFFEGKPEYWNNYDYIKSEDFLAYSKKQQKKIKKLLQERPPTLKQFCLCEKCKNNYVDNNICKGRHKHKIKHEITNFTSLLFNSENVDDDIDKLNGHAYLTDENGKAYMTDDDCRDAEGNLLPFEHECWKKCWANQVLKNEGVMIYKADDDDGYKGV